MVSVPAMTRSSMDAIKLSSWKRLSFLFFSLKNTRGKKSHKSISLSIQQAREILHNPQHCWLWSRVCDLADKIDLILWTAIHQRWSTTDGRFGEEFWSNTHLPWKQAETQSWVLFTDSASQVWKEPCTEADSANPTSEELLLPKAGFESPTMLKTTFQAISAWALELC